MRNAQKLDGHKAPLRIVERADGKLEYDGQIYDDVVHIFTIMQDTNEYLRGQLRKLLVEEGLDRMASTAQAYDKGFDDGMKYQRRTSNAVKELKEDRHQGLSDPMG